MNTPLMDPAQFATMVRQASDEDLAAGMRANRDLILEGIFAAMPQSFEPSAASGIGAVAEWRVAGEGDAQPARWQVRIADGRCVVERDGEAAPNVVYEIGGVDFLRLICGQLDGPQLFVSGRLRVQGDLILAARMPSMFTVPAAPGA
jgi:predicted lipid carrier protein YhbT